MVLAYNHITEEQDKMRNVFEKGEYPFVVKSAQQKICKNNVNTMLVVELIFSNKEGNTITVTDWIMLDMENMEWKFRHFCSTCNLLDRYDDNILEEKDFLGKHGVAKLNVSEYEKDGEIHKINRVADYVKPALNALQATNYAIAGDVPF